MTSSIADALTPVLGRLVLMDPKPTKAIIKAGMIAVDRMRWFYQSKDLDDVAYKLEDHKYNRKFHVDLAPAFERLILDKSDTAAFALLRDAFFHVMPDVAVFFNSLVRELLLKEEILRFHSADDPEATQELGFKIVNCLASNPKALHINNDHICAMAYSSIHKYVFSAFNSLRTAMPPGKLQVQWFQIGALLISAAEEMRIDEGTIGFEPSEDLIDFEHSLILW